MSVTPLRKENNDMSKAAAKQDKMDAGKQQALDAALQQIERAFGKG